MARLLGKSRIWSRGYTTIPVTVRRVLGLKDGDELEWYLNSDGKVFVKKREGGKEGDEHSS